MLSNSIKQLRHFITQTRAPLKSILISYCSPLVLYTFLNINTTVFGRDLDITINELASQELNLFLSTIKNQISVLKRVQVANYPYIDIQLLHQNQEGSTKLINLHKEAIKQTFELFAKLTPAILKQSNSHNFVEWMQICLKLQIIDIRIWNHFIKLGQENLHTLSEINQLRILKALHSYLETFFMKNTYAPSKFIYRENLINDMYYLQGLITRFFKEIVRRSVGSLTSSLEQSLKIVVTIMTKINRGLIFNLYQMQKHYKSSQKQFNNLIQNGNISTVISIMKYISFLGIYNETILQNIENKVIAFIEKNQKHVNFQQKYNLTTTILQVWNAFHYNNPTIFEVLMRPVLSELLTANRQKTPITTSIIFNMICSNLKEEELIEKLMNKVAQKHPIQSKTAHIISHYMGIQNKTKNLSSYPHCFQNKVGLQIAKNNPFIYSNCMTRSSQDYPNKQQYKPHHVSFEGTLGKQVNPPEQFWLTIMQAVFEQLNIKYPHASNKLILHFQFCVFQIDALIILNQQYFAFQYQGLHYKIQNANEDKGLASKGNKLIKQRILQAYGLKILQIDSSDPIIRNISAFRDKKNATKYIKSKIEQLYLHNVSKKQ